MRICYFFFLSVVTSIRVSTPVSRVVVPLHLHDRTVSKHTSFLSVTSELHSRLDFYRAQHNNTHAIEYYGMISVGGQPFSVLFDTGSDSLILPGVDCVSSACKTHKVYDANKSKTATPLNPKDARECKFGAGSVMGYERGDRTCLGSACADMEFVEALIESDDPFAHAKFDGVLGLSLGLRKNATLKASILDAMVAEKAIPRALFAVFLSKDLHADSSELSFGESNPARMGGPQIWAPLSEPGYWQFSLSSVSIGGVDIMECQPGNMTLADGVKVSSFFGTSTQGKGSPTCCSSMDEFDYEDRCQFWGNASDVDDDGTVRTRSRYTDDGVVKQTLEDGRVILRLKDGCLQKVPRKWVSLADGCRGDGTIQAVLDTGSSLMMAPGPLAEKLVNALGVQENCTLQSRDKFPNISFKLPTGQSLTLTPDDYMDTVVESDGVFCWPHLISMPATAKGPVFVLGMPFLRTFYTTFDAEGQRVGFAAAKQPTSAARPPQESGRSVALRGVRPGDTESELSAR